MAVGGVAIEPVDFVLGDRDGGLIIPRRVAEEVITKAEEVVHTENLVRKAILEDVLPLDAYNRHGRF
jgi:regulator of RNase E activity RraA